MNDYKLPNGWQWLSLGEVCEINPRRPELFRSLDEPTTFVPMAAVDDVSGTILSPEVKPFEAVRKGYTYFEEGDVLFAKITPCMENGKHAIARNLIDGIGFGTTEFHVLRPGPMITAEWIHRYLRQPSVLDLAATFFTGSVGQQRVPPEFLNAQLIPLPPLDEQRRIAAILDEQMAAVEQARAAAEAQLEAAQGYIGCVLANVFDTLWNEHRLQSLKTIIIDANYGTSVKCIEDRRDDYTPVLRIPNVVWEEITFDDLKYGPIESSQKNFVKDGDILIVRTNGSIDLVGRSAVVPALPEPMAFASYLIRISVDRKQALPEYVQLALRYLRLSGGLVDFAHTSAGQYNVSLGRLRDLELPLPRLAEQEFIVQKIQAQSQEAGLVIEGLHDRLDLINAIPASLMRQAFSGET